MPIVNPQSLREALSERVLVADGAMGTMLQAGDPSLDDFDGYEGCNEILNVTRPDIVRRVHEEYLAVGVDCIETNTFGANLSNLGEYDIADRIAELAGAGARVSREAADAFSTPERPRYVLGSVGPGTKLPSLGHVTYEALREAYRTQSVAMVAGGVDAILIETAQDLLQAKAALTGAREAVDEAGRDVVLIAQVTVETTGTMLLGTEIGAALTSLEPLGIDIIGLNCATGPAEMSEHLRHLSRHARIGLSSMPNAGLPQLGAEGAWYPLTPGELADAHERFVRDYSVGLVGGCCGTTPEHLRQVVERVGGHHVPARRPRPDPGASSLYAHVPFRQDVSYLAIGERTNANGSKAFREAMLAQRWDDCVEIARGMTREGAHLIDLCVDYVGRDGVADMTALASRLATASTLPVVLDSTEPAVLAAGLECLGGRAVINSVNYEDGDGPESRFARIMPLVTQHGSAVVALTIDEEGQARTADWKVGVADRLVADLTGPWGMRPDDILIDPLTFPIATGQEETRRDGVETIEAIRAIKSRHPQVQTVLGLSNVSFGLAPAARVVLNSVFLHECVKAGLDAAIVNPARILPLSRVPEEQAQVALDLVYDRRNDGYDPLAVFLEMFAGDAGNLSGESAEQELSTLPTFERLERRIVDGLGKGLEADLDEALELRPALDIVNDTLLSGMRTVGELFGSGQMQLPFVLQSAEVMKAAVAHLEPHMEKVEGQQSDGKATIVLATVKGDVHDIGKNLVDIILTNNGYRVVNLGIKQPVSAILDAAATHDADVIGMSGLLVKSTVIMKENLEEINQRGMAARWPVILGGAALTRAYVDDDLAAVYEGEVRYARDAFEGLRLMDAIVAAKKAGQPDLAAALPERRGRRVARREPAVAPTEPSLGRSDVATDVDVPMPPFWGSRVVKGIALAEYSSYLDERATFLGQWGLKPTRGGDGPGYDELVATQGRPRLRGWLDRVQAEGLLEAAVVYGYWPCYADGQTLVLLDPATRDPADEVARFTFPRQRRDRRLCLADYFRGKESGELDVVALQLVTVGNRVSEATAELFAQHSYRDYLELHGLSVQLAEALAEYWHARVRDELGLAGDDADSLAGLLRLDYRGARYSFGYPACPDLEYRADIVRLLDAGRIGVEISEELQLHPEQSTDAIVLHHPEAIYFNAG
jgi:5-methyltetrahydrofolate--homocysteine methyltransferase